MSVEALAMAGRDYKECAIELEVWKQGSLKQPPPHQLAEHNSIIEAKEKSADVDGERLKATLRQWANVITLMNENVSLSKRKIVFRNNSRLMPL